MLYLCEQNQELYMDNIRKGIMENMDEIMQNPDVFLKVWEGLYLIQQIVEEEGLIALRAMFEVIEKRELPFWDYFKEMLSVFIDLREFHLIAECMLNDYYVRNESPANCFVLYLYMLCIQQMDSDLRARVLGEGVEVKTSERMKQNLELIPERYRERFEKVNMQMAGK